MRKSTSWYEIIIIFIIVGIIVTQCSCNSTKQNFKRVNEAILEDPAQTAKQFSDKWPCVPVATVSDSTDYKQYHAELAALIERYKNIPREVISDTILEIWADTSKIKVLRKQVVSLQDHEKYLNRYISDLTELCSDKPPVHDTIKIDDYAKIQIYTSQIEQLNNEKNKYIGKYEQRSSFALWLVIALAVSTIGNILLIKFKKHAAITKVL